MRESLRLICLLATDHSPLLFPSYGGGPSELEIFREYVGQPEMAQQLQSELLAGPPIHRLVAGVGTAEGW